jgi:ABC-2 type transport system permease protein
MRQASAVFRTYLQESIAYRAQAFIWAFTDIVGGAMMLLVFLSTGKGVAGFSPREIVVYYLSLMAVEGFVTCHMQWEIGTEVKDGAFSTFLIRPFSWYWTTVLRNLSWRFMRLSLFLPVLCVFVVSYWSLLQGTSVNLGWEFWLSMFLGHFVSVNITIAMAMIAFFVEDASAIFESYYMPMLFLSGQIFPVSMLPGWAQTLSKFLPFYYTTALPAEIATGKVAGASAWGGLAVQVVWVGVAYLVYRAVWPSALRRYSGTGM